MKRRIFAMVLACAMALSLAACGNNSGGGSSSNPGSSSSDNSGISSSQPDASNPDGSQPDGSNPDGSKPDGSGDLSEPGKVTLTLNKTEVKLTKAGATFQIGRAHV